MTFARYCERQRLDAFVVSTPHNLTYLCGFTGTAGLMVDHAARARISSSTAGTLRWPTEGD